MIEFRPGKNPPAIARAPNQKRLGKEPSVNTSFPSKRPSSSGVRPTRGTREHTLSCPLLLIELVELITLKYGSFVFSRPQMCRRQALRRHTAHIPATTGGRSSFVKWQSALGTKSHPTEPTHELYHECAHNLPFNWL